MAARRIQIGQLWKKVDTGDLFLVTRLYDEALATIAVLRLTGSDNGNMVMVKVKVERTSTGQSLPGFSMAQEGEEL
jgi:hypothetical protein